MVLDGLDVHAQISDSDGGHGVKFQSLGITTKIHGAYRQRIGELRVGRSSVARSCRRRLLREGAKRTMHVTLSRSVP